MYRDCPSGYESMLQFSVALGGCELQQRRSSYINYGRVIESAWDLAYVVGSFDIAYVSGCERQLSVRNDSDQLGRAV